MRKAFWIKQAIICIFSEFRKTALQQFIPQYPKMGRFLSRQIQGLLRASLRTWLCGLQITIAIYRMTQMRLTMDGIIIMVKYSSAMEQQLGESLTAYCLKALKIQIQT